MILSPLAFAKAKQEKKRRESLAKRKNYLASVMPDSTCKHHLVPLTNRLDLSFAKTYMNHGGKTIYRCTGPCATWIALDDLT